MPRVSLENRLLAHISSGVVDPTAMTQMRLEIREHKYSRDLLKYLLSIETHYPETELMTEALSPGLILLEMRRASIPIDNKRHCLVHPSEYDPFNYLLIGNETINAGANCRANAEQDFGRESDWIVWSRDIAEFGHSRIAYVSRYLLRGQISELRRAAPDTISRLIAEGYGIGLQGLKKPILIADVATLTG